MAKDKGKEDDPGPGSAEKGDAWVRAADQLAKDLRAEAERQKPT